MQQCGSLPYRHCPLARSASRNIFRAPRASTVAKAAQAAPPKHNEASREGPILIDGQVAHSNTKESMEVLYSMTDFLHENILPRLKPVEKCWQPTDVLPSAEDENFIEEIKELQEICAALPADYLVVLVGDTITEEALPTYMAMLNTLDGVRDETGAQKTGWAQWTRAWTAEENRHGDALNKYLYLTGRVNMKAVEVTIQNLIGSGMDPKTENNPYLGFIYTSFQERATRVSHGNCSNMAKAIGDDRLSKICGLIASDEIRHENAYKKIVEELFRLDPNGSMLAFESMMKKQIVMPAHLMSDNEHDVENDGRNLFSDYSAVAERIGVYTSRDYADIMDNLIERWDVTNLRGLNESAMAAQDYVCKMPERIRKLVSRGEGRRNRGKKVDARFSWLFNEEVHLYGSK